jgi:hypothetical protein
VITVVNVIFTNSGVIYDPNAFYQYDYGRTLIIKGLDLPESVQVHFARKNAPAEIVIGTTLDKVTTVRVPASTLQYAGEFNVYIFVADENKGRTYKTITFYTREREKPDDYAPADEQNVVQQLMNKLNAIIETGIAEYTPDLSVVNQMIRNYVQANLITNNDAANVSGTAWDAVRGKAIRDDFNNSSAVINATTPAAPSSVTASYPIGYNKDNCYPISAYVLVSGSWLELLPSDISFSLGTTNITIMFKTTANIGATVKILIAKK